MSFFDDDTEIKQEQNTVSFADDNNEPIALDAPAAASNEPIIAMGAPTQSSDALFDAEEDNAITVSMTSADSPLGYALLNLLCYILFCGFCAFLFTLLNFYLNLSFILYLCYSRFTCYIYFINYYFF